MANMAIRKKFVIQFVNVPGGTCDIVFCAICHPPPLAPGQSMICFCHCGLVVSAIELMEFIECNVS